MQFVSEGSLPRLAAVIRNRVWAETLAVKFSFYVEAIFPVGIDVRVACWPEMRNIGVIDRVALRF